MLDIGVGSRQRCRISTAPFRVRSCPRIYSHTSGRIRCGTPPGGILEHSVDFADPARWKSQRDDLADTHDDIPTDHLDAGRRELLVETLPGELSVQLRERPGLIVSKEDGQKNGIFQRGRRTTGLWCRNALSPCRPAQTTGDGVN